MQINVLKIDGNVKESIAAPEAFSEGVRPDLIRRAVLSERSAQLQPQGHSVMAGIQTTAAYYGAYGTYRTGRHIGRAIRPREKLGGGVQGKVRRIPSAVKGRRAHPHMIEKTLIENMNKREYQKAMRSALAATANSEYLHYTFSKKLALPIIISDDIEKITKTKELVNVMKSIGVTDYLDSCKGAKRVKAGRRSSTRKYKKSAVFIMSSDTVPAVKASRNIAGADACGVNSIKVEMLAPGGVPGRLAIISESAFKKLDGAIERAKPPLRR
jgi:large subunit ribosomal protein L4e